MKIMPTSEQLHLVWNNHMSNMQNVLFELYNHPTLADVTISCKDGTLKAHKIILSACSPYFETVFQENPCKHPVVILKETSRNEMQMLLQFMYKGATDIPEEEMLSVIHTANELRVKGFAHAANKRGSTETSDNAVNDNREVLKDVPLHNKHLEAVQIASRTTVEETQIESKTDHVGQDKRDKVKNMVTPKEKDTRVSLLHSNKENDTESSENSEKCVHSTDIDTKSPSYSTRFRGRKRVAVGYRAGGRPRSTDKKDHEKGSAMSMRSTASKKASANSKSMENSMAIKLRSAVVDISKRRLSSDSEDDRLIPCIPDIEIKEEVDDSAEYSFIPLDYGVKDCGRADQLIKEEPINNLVLRNPDFLYYDDDDFESDQMGKKSSALKPHECEFCELSFARASHLARHRRVHTGERPFSCEICQCRFSRQDKLKQHTRRHHPIDIHTAVQKKATEKRKRGRPRLIKNETLISTADRTEETSNVSLPFGDTSYLSSLSLGQQRYKDQVANLEAATSSNAEDLLQTVRQLGECTIQAVSSCKFNV